MSFITKSIGSLFGAVGDVLGLSPKAPAAPPAPPVAPTVGNSQGALDAAERMNMAPRTSTMLAAQGTGDEDAKKTSKVLLGQ